jgi:hypothetical protein
MFLYRSSIPSVLIALHAFSLHTEVVDDPPSMGCKSESEVAHERTWCDGRMTQGTTKAAKVSSGKRCCGDSNIDKGTHIVMTHACMLSCESNITHTHYYRLSRGSRCSGWCRSLLTVLPRSGSLSS